MTGGTRTGAVLGASCLKGSRETVAGACSVMRRSRMSPRGKRPGCLVRSWHWRAAAELYFGEVRWTLQRWLGGGSTRSAGWRSKRRAVFTDHLDHAETHNEYLPDESGPFRTDVKLLECDHAPVVAQFTLLDK